ncbi:hypothetical protein [uncultured Marinobacter sp.]|uniref:hypothetical protein n=1 Tax=uncultured Marinobacter sp. TaxID=187379 RepID=UPI00258D646F|nr:hypothetical protein [uncultured Marinobacter sp.]
MPLDQHLAVRILIQKADQLIQTVVGILLQVRTTSGKQDVTQSQNHTAVGNFSLESFDLALVVLTLLHGGCSCIGLQALCCQFRSAGSGGFIAGPVHFLRTSLQAGSITIFAKPESLVLSIFRRRPGFSNLYRPVRHINPVLAQLRLSVADRLFGNAHSHLCRPDLDPRPF